MRRLESDGESSEHALKITSSIYNFPKQQVVRKRRGKAGWLTAGQTTNKRLVHNNNGPMEEDEEDVAYLEWEREGEREKKN